jgi:hypothetical protein
VRAAKDSRTIPRRLLLRMYNLEMPLFTFLRLDRARTVQDNARERPGESNDKVGQISGNGTPLAIGACRLEKDVEKRKKARQSFAGVIASDRVAFAKGRDKPFCQVPASRAATA